MNSKVKQFVANTRTISEVDQTSEWSRISRGASTMYDLGPAYYKTATWVFQASHPTFQTPFRALQMPMPEPSAEVMAIRQRNITNSLFHRLPTEIMLIIEYHAKEEVIMALRGSCARFAHILADPTALPENMLAVEKWRRTYTHRRRVYQQYDLCMQERSGLVPPSHLVCHPCIFTHERRWFSPDMRNASPEKRACIGWTSKLRLCAHKTISFQSVACYKPALWCGKKHSGFKSYWRDYLTMSTILDIGPFPPGQLDFSTIDDAGGGRGARLGIESRGLNNDQGSYNDSGFRTPHANGDEGSGDDQEVVIRAEIVLGRVARDQRMTQQGLLELLSVAHRNKDGEGLCMCPHLTFAIISLLLLQRPYSDCPILKTHSTNTIPCIDTHPPRRHGYLSTFLPYGLQKLKSDTEPMCGKRYHCLHLGCSTSFYFYRARNTSFVADVSDELVLCVLRSLGSCRDAQDHRWLVQLVGQYPGKSVSEEVKSSKLNK
jgi:hypothetical protein